ncbi:MAG: SP_1767 family glycosyltransferase [Terrisporobacter othiniensis]|uniref:SP_1767 family glycosyltransferase n=1 Tax=Terrisporobacter othiniensis TaxID=1577792 RepID=UPI00068C773B|nr:SP_1767 family glycosyltransferase [Terrisporobacter othiniensis]MDY3373019.1 SP_1767 family glycosyltransferase [Terrisporobacter othiniensis]
MIKKIKKNKIFIKIKPILVCIYNNLYNIPINSLIFIDEIINLFNRPKIMTIEESINYILDNKVSLSRFGDGEMKLIYRSDISFQKYSSELSMRLKEVLNSDTNNHMIGIPNVFGFLNEYTYGHKVYWGKNLLYYRKKWILNLRKDKIYINAFISRCYLAFKDKSKSYYYFKLIKNLWNNKDIIIVEGQYSRLGVGNDLFDNAKSIKRILCPKEDAYSYYVEILTEIKKIDKNSIIFLALGPTATVLAYDLAKLGYQAIDIGHVDIEYEWFIKKANKKIPIKSKYVAESKDGKCTSDIKDEQYLNEIISKII